MPIVDLHDTFLFDLDGVLYRGDQPIPGAAETVERLRAAGKGLAFVTNSSSRTPDQVAEKLAGMGIEATLDEIVTSAVATAELLAREGGGRAFVIGEEGIRQALSRHDIEVVDDGAGPVEYVVVGWDRSADYDKLKTAALLVQRGARLVATNADASYPAPDGLWPGAGALLSAVTTTTGVPAEVVGKPHPPLFELARDRAGGGSAISIGDRLDTDVAGAERLGWDSLLVTTGVTHPANLVRSEALPTFLGRDVSALFRTGTRIRDADDGDRDAAAGILRRAGLEPGPAGEGRLETRSWIAGTEDGTPVGTVTLELAGESAHLRSIAVVDGRDGEGTGTMLVAHAIRYARRAGVREVVLATETAERFFANLGFAREGTLEALPEVFREHMTSCAETAVVMRLAT